MNDSPKLRVAVVGCGQIADAHLGEVRKLPAAEMVAVCDRYPDLARQAADRFGVPGVYDDVTRMLAEARPDVVHVTTPPHTHAPLARQCLAAGAHVYVEKPFTIDAREADAVFAAARAVGRLVCAGHDQLFDPCFVELRERHARGELGEVVHIDSVMGYDLSGPFGRVMFNDPGHWLHRLPGGLFHNNLSHALYKVTAFLPDDRPQVWAIWFGPAGRVGAPTELRVLLRGAEVTANILFTSRARPVQRVVRVYGTRAGAEADFDGRVVRRYGPPGAPGALAKVAVPLRDMAQAARSAARNLWRFARSDLQYFAGMNELFRRFYRAILTGGEPPIPEREIRRVTAIMDDIFAAARGLGPGLPAVGGSANGAAGGCRVPVPSDEVGR
jgi:predicted dehydrogenase